MGRFAFGDVPPGDYDIRASLTGYTGGLYGQAGPLADGGLHFISSVLHVSPDAEGENIELVLWRNGSIGGAILDEVGEPVVGGIVRAVPVTAGNTRRSQGGGRTTRTDDRGRYRFPLPPGAYIIAVESPLTTLPASTAAEYQAGAGASSEAGRRRASERMANGAPWIGRASGTRVGDTFLFSGASVPVRLTAEGRVLSYPTTFYPGTTQSTAAEVVRLGPGEDREGVSIQVLPNHTSVVSGTVIGPTGPEPGLGVRLVSASWSSLTSPALDFNSVQGVTDGQGRFSLYGVAAGPYVIRVLKVPLNLLESIEWFMVNQNGPTSPDPRFMVRPPLDEPTYFSAQPISVGSTDLQDVQVVLGEGVRVSGRLVGFAPSENQRSKIAITFTPQPGSTAALHPIRNLGRFMDTDRFTTPQLIPGPYLISISGLPTGWTLRSVAVPGERADAADAPVNLGGNNIDNIIVTVTDRAAALTGYVRSNDGQPVPGAAVVAFPTDEALWEHLALSRRVRVLKSDRSGEFETDALPEGDYYLAAVTQPLAEGLTPELLRDLRPEAARTSLREGTTASVRLLAPGR
jgi:hypothetical protein